MRRSVLLSICQLAVWPFYCRPVGEVTRFSLTLSSSAAEAAVVVDTAAMTAGEALKTAPTSAEGNFSIKEVSETCIGERNRSCYMPLCMCVKVKRVCVLHR